MGFWGIKELFLELKRLFLGCYLVEIFGSVKEAHGIFLLDLKKLQIKEKLNCPNRMLRSVINISPRLLLLEFFAEIKLKRNNITQIL